MGKQKIEIPGGADTAPADDLDPQAARIAELEALLAAKSDLPQVVYEPETPHGKAKLAESDFAHMTTGQLLAKIKSGAVEKPNTGVLCSDGWFAG